ncbi:MAG: pilus assembly protein PilP [Betaproteobacteria bacterium]|nr:pilus assembly protein PilP [Betaproteobacteria bacterium]
MRGKVEPLPQVAPYEAFAYNAFELANPFAARKKEANKAATGLGPLPDTDRKREALEAFPLESLKMVGVLERGNRHWAIVKTPDHNLYRVHPGNYVGQNFGKITMVTDNAVTIQELIQDTTTGSWSERTSTLQLLEQEEPNK